MMMAQVERRGGVVSGVKKLPGVENDVGKKRTIDPNANCTATSQRIQPGTKRPLGKREKTRK